MNDERTLNVDETLSASWDQLLAVDLASEVEVFLLRQALYHSGIAKIFRH